jgi:RHS repeat-associated protein
VRLVTDPLGNFVVTDYDKLGKPTVVRQFQLRPDRRVELLSRRETEYDELEAAIRLVEAVFPSPIITADPIDHPDQEFLASHRAGQVQDSTTAQYLDAAGNVLQIRRPDGGITRQRFDGQNRAYDQTDAEGNRTFQVFDGFGNVARTYSFQQVTDPQTGNLVRTEVFLEIREYDLLNRQTARIDPYGNRWEQRRDSLGNVRRMIDPLGNVLRFSYNAFGETTEQFQERTETGLGGGPPLPPFITRSRYDPNGNRYLVIDSAQRQTEFRFDPLDRLTESRFAIGPYDASELRCYDKDDNQVRFQDRNGLVRRMTYDLLNRYVREGTDVSSVAPANAACAASATFAVYEYDASDGMVRHENDYCVTELQRDSRGLITYEKIIIRNIPNLPPQEFVILRTFDPSGRRTSLTYPSGRVVEYSYDHLSRIRTIRNRSSPPDYPGRPTSAVGIDLIRYRYTGDRLTVAELANGLTSRFRSDGRGQILERSLERRDGTLVWRMQQVRDAAGTIRLENASTRNAERSRRYGLDSLYRLTHYENGAANWLDPARVEPPAAPVEPWDTPGQAILNAVVPQIGGNPTFEYDLMGNRLRASEPNAAVSDTVPNELNQYTSVDAVRWTYDANGNLRTDGAYSLEYDRDERLQRVLDIGAHRDVTYYRDAIGRVIAEVTQAGIEVLLYDATAPLVEVTAGGRTEHTVDHVAGSVIHSAMSGEDYWITRDGVGSLRVVADASGNVVSIPTYLPFGAPEDRELELSPLRWGFAGMWFTRGLPFLYSQTRTYRYDVGRYCQRDPSRRAGRNPYSYVENDPVDRWDPTGLWEEPQAAKPNPERAWQLLEKAKREEELANQGGKDAGSHRHAAEILKKLAFQEMTGQRTTSESVWLDLLKRLYQTAKAGKEVSEDIAEGKFFKAVKGAVKATKEMYDEDQKKKQQRDKAIEDFWDSLTFLYDFSQEPSIIEVARQLPPVYIADFSREPSIIEVPRQLPEDLADSSVEPSVTQAAPQIEPKAPGGRAWEGWIEPWHTPPSAGAVDIDPETGAITRHVFPADAEVRPADD